MEHGILARLTTIVGANHVITNPAQMASYLNDWRGRYAGNALAVVKPQNTKQITELITLCQANNISIVPQGGNTSLCGGATPLNQSTPHQLIINLSLMNKILAVDTQNNSITVEAGCTGAQVIESAHNHKRYFPLSIASEGSAQIGGNIATNAGGIHVIKYGMIRDMVLGLEAVLADGTVLNQLNGLRKNNSYLDLKQLFIGSEGTLGIITKAVLKLYPEPCGYTTGLIGVKTISHAIELLNGLSAYFSVCAFEIIGNTMQEIYNANIKNPKLPLQDNWLILFELETSNHDDAVNVLLGCNLDVSKIIITDGLTSRSTLWQIRENMPVAEKINGIAVKHDISLPISSIEQFVQLNQKNIKNIFPNAQIIIFGHLGDGNLHYNIQLKTQTETIEQETTINQIVYDDVLSFGGSISAEHGIGQLKASWYKYLSDPVSYNLARQIKQQLDPNNLFNPNKIFLRQNELS